MWLDCSQSRSEYETSSSQTGCVYYHQCIYIAINPRSTKEISKASSCLSQNFGLYFVVCCDGILYSCKASGPWADFCKTPVKKCIGAVLLPNDGVIQYQIQSCLMCETGRRTFDSLLSALMQSSQKKNMKGWVWILVCFSPCLWSQCLPTSPSDIQNFINITKFVDFKLSSNLGFVFHVALGKSAIDRANNLWVVELVSPRLFQVVPTTL